ncbi:hypothetical protein Trydic_g18001 [Trypoxylus dichotomus]
MDNRYKDYIVKVKTNDNIFTGVLILPRVVVTNANMPHKIIVCALVQGRQCFKAQQIDYISQDITFLETDVEFDMPEVFKGNTASAECYEVGVGIQPSPITIKADFAECLKRTCGELEAAICDFQLAGIVTNLSALNATLFIPVSFLQDVYNRRFDFKKPSENSSTITPMKEKPLIRSRSFGGIVVPSMVLTVCFCILSVRSCSQ